MNTPAIPFIDWCDQVRHYIVYAGAGDLWKEVIRLTVEDRDEPAPEDPSGFFFWLRGDEPREAYDAGETDAYYAAFLLEEYNLFGPRGE